MYKATRWSGLESQLRDIRRAPFYPGLDRLTQDSLHVYDAMKEICRRDGHTFLLLEEDIKRFYSWNQDGRYLKHEIRAFYDTMW